MLSLRFLPAVKNRTHFSHNIIFVGHPRSSIFHNNIKRIFTYYISKLLWIISDKTRRKSRRKKGGDSLILKSRRHTCPRVQTQTHGQCSLSSACVVLSWFHLLFLAASFACLFPYRTSRQAKAHCYIIIYQKASLKEGFTLLLT